MAPTQSVFLILLCPISSANINSKSMANVNELICFHLPTYQLNQYWKRYGYRQTFGVLKLCGREQLFCGKRTAKKHSRTFCSATSYRTGSNCLQGTMTTDDGQAFNVLLLCVWIPQTLSQANITKKATQRYQTVSRNIRRAVALKASDHTKH